MTDSEVQSQLAFVRWLKSYNAYDEFATADAMRMGQKVWELAQARIMELECELAHVNCYGPLPESYSERIEKLLGDVTDK